MAEFWADGFWADGFWADGFWAGEAAPVDVTPEVIIRVRGRHNENPSNPFDIEDAGLIVKDPSDEAVYQFDWDARHLAAGVTIDSATFEIVALNPSDDEELTSDQELIDADGRRKVQLRLIGGTAGAIYRIDNAIVTSEAPTQTIERSFQIKIEHR